MAFALDSSQARGVRAWHARPNRCLGAWRGVAWRGIVGEREQRGAWWPLPCRRQRQSVPRDAAKSAPAACDLQLASWAGQLGGGRVAALHGGPAAAPKPPAGTAQRPAHTSSWATSSTAPAPARRSRARGAACARSPCCRASAAASPGRTSRRGPRWGGPARCRSCAGGGDGGAQSSPA
jgi:hypothetical protein